MFPNIRKRVVFFQNYEAFIVCPLVKKNTMLKMSIQQGGRSGN
jgi:hypothetical protein